MLLDRFRVTDRVAIVTGGSGGIGGASAVALAEQGADVVLVARRLDALQAVAARIEGLGRRAVCVSADMTDLDEHPGVVQAALDAFGRIDILVNTVGGGAIKPVLDLTAAELAASVHINTTVTFELSRLAVPHLLRQPGAAIVNVSSTMARLRDRGYLAYSAGKAALDALTQSMAFDLAPRIRVNAVAPGSDRDGRARRGAGPGHAGAHGGHDAARSARRPRRHRHGRAVPRDRCQQLRDRQRARGRRRDRDAHPAPRPARPVLNPAAPAVARGQRAWTTGSPGCPMASSSCSTAPTTTRRRTDPEASPTSCAEASPVGARPLGSSSARGVAGPVVDSERKEIGEERLRTAPAVGHASPIGGAPAPAQPPARGATT